MRKSIYAVALAGMLVWAGVAGAAPLSPDVSVDGSGFFTSGDAILGGTAIAGEGAAPNACIQTGSCMGAQAGGLSGFAVQHLDWVVVFDGNPNGGYTYYYQLENTSVAALQQFTIGPGAFLAVGHASLIDVDSGVLIGTAFIDGMGAPMALTAGSPSTVLGHTDPPYLNLDVPDSDSDSRVPDAEHEGLPGGLTCCTDPGSVDLVASAELGVFNLTAAGLVVGAESTILVAQGGAPVYADWNTSGTTAGTTNTWNSSLFNGKNSGPGVGPGPCETDGLNTTHTAPGSTDECFEDGRSVPVPGIVQNPVPEPSTILLLGSGLVGLGFWARRRQS